MAVTQEPKNGFYYNWDAGDAGWGDNVNENFIQTGLRLNLSVINQTTTAPPVSPTDGDAYIVASVATGDWAGQEGNIAVWAIPVGDSAPDWIFIVPYSGFLIFDQSDNTLYAHNGTNWSTNGFLFTF